MSRDVYCYMCGSKLEYVLNQNKKEVRYDPQIGLQMVYRYAYEVTCPVGDLAESLWHTNELISDV